ncbi:RNA--NAD 2'-phosphotransferase [Alloyangia pacifica]|uniref:RNA--NAD 2'-phosphotransferase n=1 Tax=Alloyangia pacifica TaxID=311180 RepID=A0A2U8HLF8_9RHOB|nr:RNA--NAD 2'-phosphotransferase [Alloyangia pacifica]
MLSRSLRHAPGLVGLNLAEGGWVLVDDLLRAVKMAGHRITADTLCQIVGEKDNQRFTLSGDGRRNRVTQGHSIAVDLKLVPVEPPAILFHGTTSANPDEILVLGFHPGQRCHAPKYRTTASKLWTRRKWNIHLKTG